MSNIKNACPFQLRNAFRNECCEICVAKNIKPDAYANIYLFICLIQTTETSFPLCLT